MTKYQFKLVDSLEKVMPARNPEELSELSLKGYVKMMTWDIVEPSSVYSLNPL